MELSVEDLSLIACDASGVLYGAVKPHASVPDYAGCMAVCDVRAALTDQQVGVQVLTHLCPETIIHPQPPLGFTPTSVVVSPSGRYVALGGTDENEDQAALVVVDLHGGEPASSADGAEAAPRSLGQRCPLSLPSPPHTPPTPPPTRHKRCTAHVVDAELFASRPGLVLRQVAWHPHSESHLVVLASDSRLRVYCVEDLRAPQLTLHVRPNSSGHMQLGASRYGLGACAAGEEAAAFAFGGPSGWGPFTLYLSSSLGGLYALCPLTPPGMRVPASTLRQLLRPSEPDGPHGSAAHWEGGDEEYVGGQSGPQRLAWLQAAFGLGDPEDVEPSAACTALPHVLDGHSLVLQGPLNAGAESLAPSPLETVAVVSLHHPMLGAPHAAALASARSDGRIWAHVLVASVQPAWEASHPQVAVSLAGATQAVRMECQAGLPAGGAAALLLDAVDLHLPPPPSPTSSDLEEESGDSAGALRLALHPLSTSGAHSLLAVHARGAWVVGLPWLAAAAKLLAAGIPVDVDTLPVPAVQELVYAGAAEADVDLLPGRDLLAGCSVQDVLLGRAALLLQRGGRLHVARPGLWLATAGTATSPLATTGLPEAANAGRAGGSGEAAPGRPGAKDGAADTEAQAALSAVYGELVEPPAAPALPKLPSDATASSPEGAVYLSAATQALREGGVQPAHRTHAILTQRAKALDAEAAAQQKSLEELTALAATLEERQAALAARGARAAQLHANLMERAGLLTQLHWALPRPLSAAERQLSVDLDVMASRQAALCAMWDELSRRAQRLLVASAQDSRTPANQPPTPQPAGTPVSEGRLMGRVVPGVRYWPGGAGGRHGMGGAAPAPTPANAVPAAQMRAVHAATVDNTAAIQALGGDVQRLKDALCAWVAQRERTSAAQSTIVA